MKSADEKANSFGPTPHDIERARLFAEWVAVLPTANVLKISYCDLVLGMRLPDGTGRIPRFPLTPIPYDLIKRTDSFMLRDRDVNIDEPWFHGLYVFTFDGNPLSEAEVEKLLRLAPAVS